MINQKIRMMREEYRGRALRRAELSAHPVDQFLLWFDEAVASEVPEPNAMALSTVGPGGKPSSRMVLFKGVTKDRGFTFYSNYHSRKGKELSSNAYASLLFCWLDLHRQVRLEGQVGKLSREESELYFYSRPRGSQISALISDQSSRIPDRNFIQKKFDELSQTYSDEVSPVPMPDHWGGFELKPTRIEFWQGHANRLHDRFVYEYQEQDAWQIDRLSP